MAQRPVFVGLTNKCLFKADSVEPYTETSLRDAATNIRSVIFSPKGTYLAYRSEKNVEVLRCSDWTVTASIQSSAKEMFFSPLDSYIQVWEMYAHTKEFPQGKPNMRIHKSENGELVGSFIQNSQNSWEPKWSSDEKLTAVFIDGKILVYENGQFDRFTHQIMSVKIKTFSISPTPAASSYFAVFSLGKSGQPSTWRLHKYPNFQAEEAVVNRALMQADKVAFYWNRRGTNLFVLSQSDVDKTGGSYYGKQTLSYADVKGQTQNVVFSKEGPIHAISWNPAHWNEWIAVYGHAPAKATLFNAKCEPLFEFGSGAWNTVHFSPDGTYAVLGGFGNIASGAVEVWDVRGYRRVGSCLAPDTTALSWDPRGEAIITATTYPRLTVGNGYKIWHYTGVLMHKRTCQEKENLLSILWQPGSFPKSELSTSVPKGIADSTPKPASQAYRPPGARNKPSTFTLHEFEKPHKPGESPNAAPSKAALKQKEKRQKAKLKKAEERAVGDAPPSAPVDDPAASGAKPAFVSTGDPDKDKKIKNLNKKLSDIEKLKQQKAAGKQLELNQQAKIDSEPGLLAELKQLRL